METRVLLDKATCCRDCGVLLGWTTCCCGDESFTGQGDSLLWSVTGQDDLKGVSALQL